MPFGPGTHFIIVSSFPAWRRCIVGLITTLIKTLGLGGWEELIFSKALKSDKDFEFGKTPKVLLSPYKAVEGLIRTLEDL